MLWLLEETGAPYDIQYVSIRRRDGSGAIDPANPHPHGKVPLLKDGATQVFEQSAIALYVADKFPKAGLGPGLSDPGRGEFLSLLAYYSGVIEPSFTAKIFKQAVQRGAVGWVDSDEVLDVLNARLAVRPYIAGNAFSAADVLYAGAFALFMATPVLADKKTPQLEQYVARCLSRPARARGLVRDEPGS
jgi:glutathione S-transferase